MKNCSRDRKAVFLASCKPFIISIHLNLGLFEEINEIIIVISVILYAKSRVLDHSQVYMEYVYCLSPISQM